VSTTDLQAVADRICALLSDADQSDRTGDEPQLILNTLVDGLEFLVRDLEGRPPPGS
jgi:hypothetical protein